MSEFYTSSVETAGFENSAEPSLPNAIKEHWQNLERHTEEKPGLYLCAALLLGFALQILPVRAIVWSLLRLGAFLLKPALLALGAWELYQIFTEASRR